MTKPIVASKFHQNQSLPAAHRSADRSLHNALYFYCSPTTPRSSNDPTLASWHDKRYLADSYSNYLHLAYRRAHPHYCYSSFYHCCPPLTHPPHHTHPTQIPKILFLTHIYSYSFPLHPPPLPPFFSSFSFPPPSPIFLRHPPPPPPPPHSS